MMRLIDLCMPWLLQYAPETTVFEPACYPEVAGRLGRLSGYLQATRAAVLALGRSPIDWATRPDPWAALGELVARAEAEFPGRLLIGQDDFARWEADPDGLTWGVLGVMGLGPLVRSADDLGRLPALFDRGVRLFRPIDGRIGVLGGSSAAGDDRGLTDLGLALLETLARLGPDREIVGPTPMLDLARMGPRSLADALDWFEADPDRPRRLVPVCTRAAPGSGRPDAIGLEALGRLRALGGTIGIAPLEYDSPEAFRHGIEAAASLPFLGRVGTEGIALATDYLAAQRDLPGLNQADQLIEWVRANLAPNDAGAIIAGNARWLLSRAVAANGLA